MGHSEFVDLVTPLGERLKHYDPKRSPTDQPDNDAVYAADPARAVPQSFLDAMIVREEVYVKEQKVPLENELDGDDARSFHWVVYASIPAKAQTTTNGENGKSTSERKRSNSTKIPIGTVRLVPPPHAPHSQLPSTNGADSPQSTSPTHEDPKEPYIKLGRLAVIKEFRKAGISKLLIETALAYAKEHPYDVGPQLDLEVLKKGVGVGFTGLVLIHAQTGVQKVWKKYAFETDENMGTWMEEGIEHVAMWKRLDVAEARRRSIWNHHSMGLGLTNSP